MGERASQMLRSIRDVDGVCGSFVWAKNGQVVARDLPEYLDAGLVAEVGPRLQRLYEAFQSAGDELDAATLVFGEYKLHVRELEPAFIAVLSEIPVNMAALRMALSVIGRRLASEWEQIGPGNADSDSEGATASGEPKPAGSAGTARYYRGNRVPD